jgi:uncharacterized membrane protein YoaK (UPF0700 family)
VGSAGLSFMIGFNYGAFGVVFFDQLLTVWVIATVVLVASLFTELPPRTWPRRALLLLPSLWLATAWADNAFPGDHDNLVFALTVAVTIVVLPFLAWIIITAIHTDFADLPGRNKALVVAAVLLFILVGFGIGARNDLVLDCEDFQVSGNDLPDNCVHRIDRPG